MNTDPNIPEYVTCACQHCGNGIEFDAGGLEAGETRSIACPHCGTDTEVFADRKTAKTSAQELFYYRIGDKEFGPYTAEQISSLWNNGRITANACYRKEGSTNWCPLAESPLIVSPSPLGRIHRTLLWIVCLISVLSFFLTTASISLPIFGKIEVSMFDFLVSKPQQVDKTKTSENGLPDKLPTPNIRSVVKDINSGDGLKLADAGTALCGLAVLGFVTHYALTVLWAALALIAKNKMPFKILTAIWLCLAIQFPIVFSIGARIAIQSIKAEAMKEVEADNPFSGLGAALLNQVSLQPGTIAWVLMVFAALAIAVPLVNRKTKNHQPFAAREFSAQ